MIPVHDPNSNTIDQRVILHVANFGTPSTSSCPHFHSSPLPTDTSAIGKRKEVEINDSNGLRSLPPNKKTRKKVFSPRVGRKLGTLWPIADDVEYRGKEPVSHLANGPASLNFWSLRGSFHLQRMYECGRTKVGGWEA